MSRFARKGKKPAGFEIIEPTLEVLEQELRDKVNEPHEGKRKVESLWPVHQINWQRSRYVYDMYWRYGKISREVYDYCIRNKLIDGPLCAKWRKPGYERLCSTYVINTKNYNFGTVSICRVPRQSLGEDQVVECPTTGCRGCGSGAKGSKNIFGNKYGQHLARIQVHREARAERLREAAAAAETAPSSSSSSSSKRKRDDRRTVDGVVGRAATRVWAENDDEDADDDDVGPAPPPPPPTTTTTTGGHEEDDDDGAGAPPSPPKQPRASGGDDDGAAAP